MAKFIALYKLNFNNLSFLLRQCGEVDLTILMKFFIFVFALWA